MDFLTNLIIILFLCTLCKSTTNKENNLFIIGLLFVVILMLQSNECVTYEYLSNHSSLKDFRFTDEQNASLNERWEKIDDHPISASASGGQACMDPPVFMPTVKNPNLDYNVLTPEVIANNGRLEIHRDNLINSSATSYSEMMNGVCLNGLSSTGAENNDYEINSFPEGWLKPQVCKSSIINSSNVLYTCGNRQASVNFCRDGSKYYGNNEWENGCSHNQGNCDAAKLDSINNDPSYACQAWIQRWGTVLPDSNASIISPMCARKYINDYNKLHSNDIEWLSNASSSLYQEILATLMGG